jgi:hypothetical protein
VGTQISSVRASESAKRKPHPAAPGSDITVEETSSVCSEYLGIGVLHHLKRLLFGIDTIPPTISIKHCHGQPPEMFVSAVFGEADSQ